MLAPVDVIILARIVDRARKRVEPQSFPSWTTTVEIWPARPESDVMSTGQDMDAIDRKIVVLLQDDASLSLAQIAHRVGLSQSPCWKRIQRLEKAGVILKRVALVSPESIGMGLTVFVSIETGDHSTAWLARFAQTVTAMPEVMEFHRMADDIDYMLRGAVPNMPAYDAFYKRLSDTIPLKNVTSRFAMERIKSTTAYPLPAETKLPRKR